MSSSPRMLVTGAGKRVGAALAEYFAARGWNLVLHYHRSQAETETLASNLRAEHGVEVALIRADLSAPDASKDFWNDVPPCTALIHNAAMFVRDQLGTMDDATFHDQLQVNFATPLLLCQGFMKQLPTGSEGNIIVLGDGGMGWSIGPEFFSYAISKQAWAGSLDVLAAAVAPRARVNIIALGPTLPGAQDAPGMFERLAQQAPLQRTGTPPEICSAVEFLLTAPGVTGQVLSLANGHGLATYRAAIG